MAVSILMRWYAELRRLFVTDPLVSLDIRDLLSSVPTLQSADVRIGWPDDPTLVEVTNPEVFSAALDAALCAFDTVRPGAYLVDAEVNSCHGETWVRFVKGIDSKHGDGKIESPLRSSFS